MNDTAKDRMNNIDALLDEYEVKLGLPKFQEQYNEDVSKYLNLSRVELAALGSEECSEIAFLLAKCSLHVQRSQNREQGRITWAGGAITELIAKNNYAGFYDAIKNNDSAIKLIQIKNYAQQRMERLKYLSNSIKHMSDLLIELKKTKEREQR
jgi:hypothetical protein